MLQSFDALKHYYSNVVAITLIAINLLAASSFVDESPRRQE